MTATGIGVDAIASGTTGTALVAVATSGGTAISANAGTGAGLLVNNNGTTADDAEFSTGSIAGEAFLGINNGIGVAAEGFASNSTTVPALIATSHNGAPAIIAHSLPLGVDIMSLDGSGNMILSGSLTTFGTPLVARRNSAGSAIGAFSPQQTTRTMEDVGEAQLAGGRTRLVGRTWYQHHLWPDEYWTPWSDEINHAIHTRVLNHIKSLTERDRIVRKSGI